MFSSIEEGLAAYRAELARYREHVGRLHERHGCQFYDLAAGHRDRLEVEIWWYRICGMARGLGLTKAEEHELVADANLVMNPQAPRN